MFKDVELSKDVMSAYRAVSAADLKGGGMDMSVSVLTSGFWPTYPLLDVMLPQVRRSDRVLLGWCDSQLAVQGPYMCACGELVPVTGHWQSGTRELACLR